ncbi:Transcriptional activator Ogr/delta (fragment) [Pseudodesulfovibrio profundus]|uniref:Transcriptional activator Ogr/delta n=1 Tax=Pseudodesulfovibrio profundus TaxID=57320 RepID=A0A2C8FF77_9BACT
MAFRVYCPICEDVAVIHSSNAVDPKLKEAYCYCTNQDCGHSFVMSIEFSHTVSPSALSLPQDLRKRISETQPEQQASLFAHAGS